MERVTDPLAYRDGDASVTLGPVSFPARLLEGPGTSLDELLAALPTDHADVAAVMFSLPKVGWRPVVRRGSTVEDDLDVVLAAPHDTRGESWSLIRLYRTDVDRFQLTAEAGPLHLERS